jgi:hypothetical protein
MMDNNIYRPVTLSTNQKKKMEDDGGKRKKFFLTFLRSPGRNPEQFLIEENVAWYTTIIKVILSEHQQQGALIMALN